MRTRCFEKDVTNGVPGTFMELIVKPIVRQASTTTNGDGLMLMRYNFVVEVGSCDRCDAVLDTFKVQEARGVATRSTSRARTVGGLYHHLHKKPQPKATVQFPWR